MADREKLLVSRIKQLEIERNEVASERDKLLLDQKTVLNTYTEWLLNNSFILTSNVNIDHVAKFKKAIDKFRRRSV